MAVDVNYLLVPCLRGKVTPMHMFNVHDNLNKNYVKKPVHQLLATWSLLVELITLTNKPINERVKYVLYM